jgi:hypothetical protein
MEININTNDLEKEEQEQEQLKYRQQTRLAALNAFITFIGSLGKATGKGSRSRKILHSRLCWGAYTVFATEEAEFQYINKFGRGMFSHDIMKVFNEEEMITIRLIAEAFGAFNY